MRTIALTNADEFPEIYLIKSVLENVPTKDSRYTIGDVRSAIKICDKLDALPASGGNLDLEEADYAWFVNRISSQQWPFASRDLITLVDKIRNATEVGAAPASPAPDQA